MAAEWAHRHTHSQQREAARGAAHISWLAGLHHEAICALDVHPIVEIFSGKVDKVACRSARRVTHADLGGCRHCRAILSSDGSHLPNSELTTSI